MMCCKNLRYHRVGENGGSNQVNLDDRETAIYPDSNRQTATYPLICPDTPQSHGLPHLSLRCLSQRMMISVSPEAVMLNEGT